ncbi:MAG: zinc-ribbon domain-containing protein [Candidatus Bathyarchaeota archaeon]|nr:zinc-ribbon domain-containing protein [Candidatus Bathyarchaeota archaeon]
MVYCSNCGEKIPKDANFCPKCGAKAIKNMETAAPPVSDEMRETLNKISQELEKAFAVAAKEISAAFQTVSENIKKSLQREAVACPSCGAKNPSGAVFCYECGKRIKSE